MKSELEPVEHIKPGKRPLHERDDSRQEREKDYVKQVHQPHLPQHQQQGGHRGRLHH